MKLLTTAVWCCLVQSLLCSPAGKIGTVDYDTCEWQYKGTGGWIYCKEGYVAVSQCRAGSCNNHARGLNCCRMTYGGKTMIDTINILLTLKVMVVVVVVMLVAQ